MHGLNNKVVNAYSVLGYPQHNVRAFTCEPKICKVSFEICKFFYQKCYDFVSKGRRMLQLMNFNDAYNRFSLPCQQSICQSWYLVIVMAENLISFFFFWWGGCTLCTHTHTCTLRPYVHLLLLLNLVGKFDSSEILESDLLALIHDSNHYCKELS